MTKEFLVHYVDELLKDVETYDDLSKRVDDIHIYITALIDCDYFKEAIFTRDYWDKRFHIKLDEVHM